MLKLNRKLFYLLSFTWGLPMSIIGAALALLFILIGKRPKKCGYSFYFEVGRYWGGVNFGPFFFVEKDATDELKTHEFGHAVQNCFFGVLFPFAVALPSFIRYWYREIRFLIGRPCTTSYYDIWFEEQASDFGEFWLTITKDEVNEEDLQF